MDYETIRINFNSTDYNTNSSLVRDVNGNWHNISNDELNGLRKGYSDYRRGITSNIYVFHRIKDNYLRQFPVPNYYRDNGQSLPDFSRPEIKQENKLNKKLLLI